VGAMSLGVTREGERKTLKENELFYKIIKISLFSITFRNAWNGAGLANCAAIQEVISASQTRINTMQKRIVIKADFDFRILKYLTVMRRKAF
jgi:hypothetical protein